MKKLLLSIFAVLALATGNAQNVGVGTATPNASAALDVTATNKGLLPPRVALTSTTDASTIASPAAGLLVYNTATAGTAPNNVAPGYYYYTGLSWYRLSTPGTASGDMQYWNGSQWVLIPAGANGLQLTICNGVPQWGPCGSSSGTAPTVTTNSITSIAGTTASAGGNVTADGGATITERGVVYGLAANPTTADTKVAHSTPATGSYTVSLSGLTPSTTYHLRAYAINSVGTSYGGDSTFTTTGITAPVISTTVPFGISNNAATSGGTVSSNGGTPLTARGIVWSANPAPTLANNVIIDVSITTGTFTSNITGLSPNTTYYVRAYATNSVGTTYGSEQSFTTLGSGAFAATYTFDNVTSSTGVTDPTPVPSVTGLTFGSFAAVNASANPNTGFRFSFTNWTLGATNGSDVFTSVSDSADKYYEVTITPDLGKQLTLSSLTFTFQRSSTGVRQCFVRSSTDAFTSNLEPTINPANANLSVVSNKIQATDPTTTAQTGPTFILGGPAFTNLTAPVTFRFYGVNAEAYTGTFSIDNVVFNGSVN